MVANVIASYCIEKTLLKSDAVYPYTESLNESFIIQAGQNCFVKKKILEQNPSAD